MLVPDGVGQHHEPAAVMQGHECPVCIEKALVCFRAGMDIWRRETSLALPGFIRHIYSYVGK